jgi:hypothetical protein
MDRRSEWDEQWRHLAALLRRTRRAGGLTLTEAQQLFDTAPDMPLSPAFVQSVLAQLSHRRATDAAPVDCHLLGDWVFCAASWAPPTAELAEPPSVIGICGGHTSAEGMTRIQSDAVDVRRICMTWPASTRGLDGHPTDTIVLDVLNGCQDLDRSQVYRIRQGVVLWDACIDGRGLEGCEVASLCDSWCDREGHASDFVGRIFQN